MRRLVQFSLSLSAFVFFFVAYASFSVLEETQPYGTNEAFVVTRVESASKSEAIKEISQITQKRNVNILKSQPQLSESFSARTFYLLFIS